MGPYLDLQTTQSIINKGFDPIKDVEIMGDYYYQNDKLVYWEFLEKTKDDGSNKPIYQIHIYDALKWLRGEKKIHIVVDFDKDMIWYYQIALYNTSEYCNNCSYEKHYNSYEEATLAGIKYVLDNLI